MDGASISKYDAVNRDKYMEDGENRVGLELK